MIVDSMFWGAIVVGIFAGIIGLALNVYVFNAPHNGSLVGVNQSQLILGSSYCNRNVILNLTSDVTISFWNINGPNGNKVIQ